MKNKTEFLKKPETYGLAERILDIQMGREDINTLISEYIPFIKSSVYQTMGKHISKESDEMSIGLLAFNEAIKSYDANKGPFLSFAKWVIRRRVIDYLRKQTKEYYETNFSDLSQVQKNQIFNSTPPSEFWVENPLKMEIEALSGQLKPYDIEFEDLIEASPKARKTKALCKEVIEYIIENPAILTKVRQKKRIPIKIFQENLNIPPKFMNRHRKYIIAVVEILSGDYVYLQEYVAFRGKG